MFPCQTPYLALAIAGLASPLLAGTWTVDPSGAGDFTTLQAAIDHASDGDVLLIEPAAASYGTAVTTKSLTFLGRTGSAAPRIESLDVQAAGSVTLFALQFDKLRVQDVPGTTLIESCYIGTGVDGKYDEAWYVDTEPGSWQTASPLLFQDCADARVVRTESLPGESFTLGFAAALVRGSSHVQFTSCRLIGKDVDSHSGLEAWGGDALDVGDDSHVLVAGSQLIGGHGENDVLDGWYLKFYGVGGNGLVLRDAATAEVRGDTSHLMRGGLGNGMGDPSWGLSNHLDGHAIRCAVSATGTADLYGPATDGDVDACAIQHGGTRPFLALEDTSVPFGPAAGPGGQRSASLHGTPGATVVLAGSIGPDILSVGVVQTTPIWIQFAGLFQTTLGTVTGPEAAFPYAWPLPTDPAFAGTEVHLQGFELLPSLAFAGTNAGAIVLGY